MWKALAVVLVLGWVSVCIAEEGVPAKLGYLDLRYAAPQWFAGNNGTYKGARGLVTLEGITGMYLNPTSGTLAAGKFTTQYCIALLKQAAGQNTGTENQHTAMATYGVTDWLEIGALGRISDLDNNHQSLAAGGPVARVRLFKDEGIWPEFSIGGMLREGNERLLRRTVFVAGSKKKDLENDIVHSLRLHAGFRQFWQDSSVNVGDASIFYLGGEVEFGKNVFLVGEVSTKDDAFKYVPFSAGFQLRGADGKSFDIAIVQTGNDDEISMFIGVGMDF
ncbi:MAG: hypothetical protein A3A88_00805 [Nitrospirae bacterium RIFCSPLOWO2_01_FULL_62_17]|nr:MAG: hypothetical protein A3A88_00805 [Nitrospirae bacterium RIFCSPLOWO2_01_FULL_62_17]